MTSTYTHDATTQAALDALAARMRTLGDAAYLAGRTGTPFDRTELNALRDQYRALEAPRTQAAAADLLARGKAAVERRGGPSLVDGHQGSDIYAVEMMCPSRYSRDPESLVAVTVARNVHGVSAAHVLANWGPQAPRVSAVYPDRCG